MLKIDYPIIVEGKYDKAFLSSFIDGTIITTNGFQVYNSVEFASLIKKEAKDNTVIVLTDSDSAGKQIRNYLKNILKNIKIINIYIPQIKGKEKRKKEYSKEGFLGVEGVDKTIILNLIKNSINNLNYSDEKPKEINTFDMYSLGFLGKTNSKENRQTLLKRLNLPQNLSNKMLLEVINKNYSKKEFLKFIESEKV